MHIFSVHSRLHDFLGQDQGLEVLELMDIIRMKHYLESLLARVQSGIHQHQLSMLTRLCSKQRKNLDAESPERLPQPHRYSFSCYLLMLIPATSLHV